MVIFNLLQPAKNFFKILQYSSIYTLEEVLNALMAIELTQVRVVGVCNLQLGQVCSQRGQGFVGSCSGWTNLWPGV